MQPCRRSSIGFLETYYILTLPSAQSLGPLVAQAYQQQQLSELYLTVLVDDVLRLSWTLELMADAGLGDATATAELQGHVDSEHFAQHPAIAAALGETFVVEPPASARR